ncbi:MAG: hypothetical protein SFU99_16700 [Saprospiraceae bacterium]|nr:hypothetical protein [Saprospiraceae bacterium]
MLNKFHQLATARNVIIFLLLDFIMMSLVMPQVARKLQSYASGIKPIDLEIPTYSTDRAYEILSAYNAEALNYYKNIELSVDIIYPIIYGLAFALTIAFLWTRILPNKNWVRWLPLIPLKGMLFDFAENIGIIFIINQLPARANGLTSVTAIFSLLKWSLDFLAIGLILVGFVVWIRKSKLRKTSP